MAEAIISEEQYAELLKASPVWNEILQEVIKAGYSTHRPCQWQNSADLNITSFIGIRSDSGTKIIPANFKLELANADDSPAGSAS